MFTGSIIQTHNYIFIYLFIYLFTRLFILLFIYSILKYIIYFKKLKHFLHVYLHKTSWMYDSFGDMKWIIVDFAAKLNHFLHV